LRCGLLAAQQRGTVHIEHTLAKRGAEKLWTLVNKSPSSTRSAR
jgi:isocitrate lyase